MARSFRIDLQPASQGPTSTNKSLMQQQLQIAVLFEWRIFLLHILTIFRSARHRMYGWMPHYEIKMYCWLITAIVKRKRLVLLFNSSSATRINRLFMKMSRPALVSQRHFEGCLSHREVRDSTVEAESSALCRRPDCAGSASRAVQINRQFGDWRLYRGAFLRAFRRVGAASGWRTGRVLRRPAQIRSAPFSGLFKSRLSLWREGRCGCFRCQGKSRKRGGANQHSR